jgi:hypothetical protein
MRDSVPAVPGGTLRDSSDSWPVVPRSPVPGWVWLFMVGQAAACVQRVRHLVQAGHTVWTVRHATGPTGAMLRGYASTRAVLGTMLIALGVMGIAKIVRRGHDTRRYWVVSLPFMLTLSAVIVMMNAAEAGALAAKLGHPVAANAGMPRVIGGWLSLTLWWLYWKRSRRVREAFEPPAWPDRVRDDAAVETLAATGV